ncbi:MAG TPA: AAC(3) family N-acetyltransferase [Armatimonadota bacterium]|nr:AAC(3) family N-acetyltransferase [Armatimonadota bacterium]HOM82311.1 AAC(3) family N-acetyltransferase [Armatimonadota bacterium]HPO72074.1 AAC(3) family N-acetyltransferase [Armatimonadota bacterium]
MEKQGDHPLPRVTTADLVRDLRALGLRAGDVVLVHSAMSRIGYVDGGAPAVVQAFLDVLGPEGTLVVPTFPFRGSMLDYCRSGPLFDVQATPSLVGAITEAARLHPDARRSLEPTHPVAAIGPRAGFLLDDHINAKGSCDEHSPLYRLTQCDGYVLLLGVDFRNCTLLHTAEELARVPFIDFETRYRLRGRDRGRDYVMEIYCHSAPIPARFDAIEPVLREKGLLTLGRVGAAECRLARAKAILDTALAELARDPYFLRARPAEKSAQR